MTARRAPPDHNGAMEPDPLDSLPKVLLHEHLDGGLRLGTLRELLAARGLPCPARDDAELARWFHDRAHAGSLAQYLQGFGLTVAAMATPAALERVAREAAEDAAAEGCVLAEFRIAPLLFEAFGIDGDSAVAALLAGLAASPIPCGLIVCAMRHLAESETRRAAELALRWQGRGVIGFDLAGAEAGHPPGGHARTLARVREAGLPITLHAGEADDGARVLEAAAHGALRIGHGVRIAGDAALVERVRELGLHLEVCPTSNVHTGACASLAEHPLARLWRAGVSLSFHTDNRLISRTTMPAEARLIVGTLGLAVADVAAMTLQAARRSFMAGPARAQAEAAVRTWAARHAVDLPA